MMFVTEHDRVVYVYEKKKKKDRKNTHKSTENTYYNSALP
jgi:hypothetical protein